MSISIIVPTFNGKDILQKNILPLEPNVGTIVNELIIVDNNSQDGTAELFSKVHHSVKYIKLPLNFGFTKAVNKGALEAKGEYLLILNNDCTITHETIRTLYHFLKDHNEYVATQPVVLLPNETVENIGYWVDLKKGKATTINTYQSTITNSKDMFKTGQVYGMSAACLLIKKSEFIKIGLFDESFHSYLEDIDLFIRLAKAGYTYSPCLKASVVHEHMFTSGKMKGYKEWHDFINWNRIVLKNYPFPFIMKNFGSLFTERLRNLNGYFKKVIFS